MNEKNEFLLTDNENFGMEYINKVCLLSQLKEAGDSDLSNYTSEVFENIKDELIEKATSYEFEDFQYDYVRDRTNIKLNTKSIKITETPVIAFNNVQCFYNSKSHKIKISLDLSADCKGTGVYELDGIANRFVPIRGNGNFSIEVKQLSGKAHLIANFNGNQFIMDSLIVRLSIGTVNANFENLLERDLSPIANALLNNMAKPLIDKLIFNNDHKMKELMKRWHNSLEKIMSKESIDALINTTKE